MEHSLHIGYTNKRETINYIIVAVLCIAYCIGVWFFMKHVRNVHNSRTFIYTKTGKKYYAHKVVKAKHPETGEWYDAVLYESFEDRNFYVREYEDFLLKFQTLSQSKENEK